MIVAECDRLKRAIYTVIEILARFTFHRQVEPIHQTDTALKGGRAVWYTMFRALTKAPSLSTSVLRQAVSQNPCAPATSTSIFPISFGTALQFLTRRWKGTYGREYQVASNLSTSRLAH